MAILATAVWEFRQTGSNNNGGGFDTGIANYGTDYTLQDTAQLSLNDLVMSGTGTTITSVTGGFTAAMIGNAMRIISGNNFTVGYYFITTVTNTNTITVDRNATNGSNATVGVGNVGGARAAFTDLFLESLTAFNRVYVKYGTYTLTESIYASTLGKVSIEGYNTTRGDNPIGTLRPTIVCGANTFILANAGWSFYNLIFTTTDTSGIRVFDGIIYNCKSTNTSVTANQRAYTLYPAICINCEAISTNGVGIFTAPNSSVINCYTHDSSVGITLDVAGTVVNSVIDTCATGILLTTTGSSQRHLIFGNTIYNCSTYGINLLSQINTSIIQNIISTCNTGIRASALITLNRAQNNVFNGNNTNNTNIILDNNNIISDPLMNSPANGDFTLKVGSAALNAGIVGSVFGLTGNYKWNIGYAQNEISSGGVKSHSYMI